ncbi:probable protein phosphatase CG10417 [Anabrus simplex]|uniref:probable protein phosphatase CG10417 n=1 Tax=Anabrus simplex TaxID=316456 RepID=UPI0035A27BDE
MGAYLSEPVTEKVSSDGSGKYVSYGASSMQGWRVTQEDAHNCIVDFDNDTSLFAVYDGHGGHEVAAYASEHYPHVLKKSERYKEGELELALKETFLEFDAHLGSEEGLMNLELVSRDKNSDNQDGNVSSDSETADNVHLLCQEAQLPIEEVIAKYHSENPFRMTAEEAKKLAASPYLRAQRSCSSGVGQTSFARILESDGGCSSHHSAAGSSHCSDESETVKDSKNFVNEEKCTSDSSNYSANVSARDLKKKSVDDSGSGECNSAFSDESKALTKDQCDGENHLVGSVKDTQNGDVMDVDAVSKPTTLHENGEASSFEKNRVISHIKCKRVGHVNEKSELNSEKPSAENETQHSEQQSSTQPLKQVYRDLLAEPSETDSDDDGDETFHANDHSEDDDDEGDEEEEDVEEEGQDEEDSSVDGEDDDITTSTMEVPGMDSGCTAVVALLRGRDLYVANAGDSRCVLSHKGKAVDMSVDHKPEDDEERERILNAGGKVTLDGRVNGGLNLSRAFGDHAYKQNVHLSPEEQMITASPDIKKCVIHPAENDFMVLACDGIWNYMSSQQVVDFVRKRLPHTEKLSTICEELFDHCLAPNTLGDGTGCDNMTAVIVKFLPDIADAVQSLPISADCEKGTKRPASSDTTSEDAKRRKIN